MTSNWPYEVVVDSEETHIEDSRYTVATDVSNEDAEFIVSACQGYLEAQNIVGRIMTAKGLRDWDEVNMAVIELCDLFYEHVRG